MQNLLNLFSCLFFKNRTVYKTLFYLIDTIIKATLCICLIYFCFAFKMDSTSNTTLKKINVKFYNKAKKFN